MDQQVDYNSSSLALTSLAFLLVYSVFISIFLFLLVNDIGDEPQDGGVDHISGTEQELYYTQETVYHVPVGRSSDIAIIGARPVGQLGP